MQALYIRHKAIGNSATTPSETEADAEAAVVRTTFSSATKKRGSLTCWMKKTLLIAATYCCCRYKNHQCSSWDPRRASCLLVTFQPVHLVTGLSELRVCDHGSEGRRQVRYTSGRYSCWVLEEYLNLVLWGSYQYCGSTTTVETMHRQKFSWPASQGIIRWFFENASCRYP